MSTLDSGPTQVSKRREDFPVESFRHLEAKLQEIRRIVMNRAAEIADVTDSHPNVYQVERCHVDHALAEFLSDSAAAREQLGLQGLPSNEK